MRAAADNGSDSGFHPMRPTLYDRLSVSPAAPAEVIRAAYRVLSQRHHPDRNGGDAASARTMQAINEAYAVLSDPQRRRAYDAALRAASSMADVASSAVAAPNDAQPQPLPRVHRHRRGRRMTAMVAVLLALPLVGAGVGLWRAGAREDAPTLAARPAVEWRLHGLDTPVQAAPPPPRPVEPTPASPPRAEPITAPLPSAAAGTASTASPAASTPPAMPIMADPNGRPWPFGAAYVAGLPQTHGDGLATVVLDNAMNPAPVFVTLVALDDGAAEAVRHVHVPATGRFQIENVRAGRYEVHHRDLMTGALTRSEPFELQQVQARYGARATTRTVALDPWAPLRASMAAGGF